MRNVGKMAVLSACVLFAMTASGCKKKFDPNDFDAGAVASGSAAASATTPPVDSSAATDTGDAGDGLAPLAVGKVGTTHVAATGGGNATKPHGEISECVQARHFCNELPAGERGKGANQKSCQDAKFACFNKGGHI